MGGVSKPKGLLPCQSLSQALSSDHMALLVLLVCCAISVAQPLSKLPLVERLFPWVAVACSPILLWPHSSKMSPLPH